MFASIALVIAPAAFAQVMGEYGTAVGHSAASTSALPRLAPRSGLENHRTEVRGAGSTHTEQVRTDDSSYDADNSSGQNTDANDAAAGDWEQVK